jgi:multiple sugar transport system substrate-binding protein
MPDDNIYTIWNFSKNQDTAKEFLKYYIDHYDESFQNSGLYNMPMHADRYKQQLFTAENGKYGVLQNYRDPLVQGFGYPGPPNFPAQQVQANFVIPDMVATAVKQQGDAGIKAAIDLAKSKLKIYYG